jgi:hypothetical protein
MTRVLSIVATVFLFCSTPVFAQSASLPVPRFGLGVSLTTGGDGSMPSLEVPINITSHFRLQPEFRYQNHRQSETQSITFAGQTLSESTELASSTTWLGTSVLYLATDDHIAWHLGGKFGLARSAAEVHDTGTGVPTINASAVGNGYFVGGVIGGEYFLHDRFSLGASVSFVYRSVDLPMPVPSPSVPVATFVDIVGERRFDTVASFTARVYVK